MRICDWMSDVCSSDLKYNAAYCASKAAIGAITRCLAVEWAKQGIRVVDVAPGFTLTDLNRRHLEDPKFRGFIERALPRGPPGEPWEVARFVAALVARSAGRRVGKEGVRHCRPRGSPDT